MSSEIIKDINEEGEELLVKIIYEEKIDRYGKPVEIEIGRYQTTKEKEEAEKANLEQQLVDIPTTKTAKLAEVAAEYDVKEVELTEKVAEYTSALSDIDTINSK